MLMSVQVVGYAGAKQVGQWLVPVCCCTQVHSRSQHLSIFKTEINVRTASRGSETTSEGAASEQNRFGLTFFRRSLDEPSFSFLDCDALACSVFKTPCYVAFSLDMYVPCCLKQPAWQRGSLKGWLEWANLSTLVGRLANTAKQGKQARISVELCK